MAQQKKIILPLVALFILFSGSLVALKSLFAKWGIDNNILIIANVLFFLVSLFTFFMQQKAMANSNPNVFVRSVMAGILIKMFVCIAGVLVYRLAAGNGISKVSVYAAMCLYLFYLAAEVSAITKLNKQKNA